MNYIVSHPKCGRTWLRALLSYTIGSYHDVELPRFLFSVSTLTGVEPLFPSSKHDTATDAIDYAELDINADSFTNDKVVFLVRHPIDTAVSWYYHKVFRARDWEGSLDDFVADPQWGLRKIVAFYNKWFEAREIPAAFMPVSYEQLHKQPASTLRHILDFYGMDKSYQQNINYAVDEAAFDNMRNLECNRDIRLAVDKLRARGPRTPEELVDERSFKVREGKIHNGRRHITPAVYRRCVRWMHELNCAYYVNKDAWKC